MAKTNLQKQTSNSQQLESAGLTFLIGFSALLCFQLLGEVSVRLLSIPVPGPVVGLILILLFLLIRKKIGASEPMPLMHASSALLTHLSLLFVPASVGVITHLDKLIQQWQPIALALVGASFVTLIVTAFSLKFFIHLMNKEVPE
jgi:holin-like protein